MPRSAVKADGSPVTAADEAAEAVICDGLKRLAPSVPVISEEQAAHDRPNGRARGSYFLVDPLDGTKEFISGRDEYTVNIALVTDGAPILGIVTAPAAGIAWRGIVGRGAERLAIAGGKASSAEADPHQAAPRPRASGHGQPLASRAAHARAFSRNFRRQSSCNAARR